MHNWMIYGANGYTGELIAREAVKRGQRPVLAGRNAEAIGKLAGELECQGRVFGLDRIDLSGVAAVVHCAGPFIRTSKPMVDACLAAGMHYLDITGEISVFEAVLARDAEAKARGSRSSPASASTSSPPTASARCSISACRTRTSSGWPSTPAARA